eukprot:gene16730-biopygen8878
MLLHNDGDGYVPLHNDGDRYILLHDDGDDYMLLHDDGDDDVLLHDEELEWVWNRAGSTLYPGVSQESPDAAESPGRLREHPETPRRLRDFRRFRGRPVWHGFPESPGRLRDVPESPRSLRDCAQPFPSLPEDSGSKRLREMWKSLLEDSGKLGNAQKSPRRLRKVGNRGTRVPSLPGVSGQARVS